MIGDQNAHQLPISNSVAIAGHLLVAAFLNAI